MSTHWKTTELARVKEVYEQHGAKVAAHAARRTVTAIHAMAHRQQWVRVGRWQDTREGTLWNLAERLAADGVVWSDLVAETGCTANTARSTLSQMVKRGRLVNTGGRPALYLLTERGYEL